MTDQSSHTARLESALAGRYKIQRKLGEGGMASVYLAEDIKHERNVALKILKPELAAVIGAERFLAEIKTTANLQHPHILPLFDSGEADGFLYYVMPFIDGETLRDRIDREGQLGVEEAVRIARDVADALDYAHRNDIIHRDIKPANVLLHDGRPVVSDFGIALAISAAGGGRMTETGLSLGTPHYMSPEQASADRDLSARSDVYSLGCVLYEMLAGQPPHTGPSAQNVLVRILTEDPRDITQLRRTVPPNVAAAVMKSIEKLPADRFDTARQFSEALSDTSFAYAPSKRTTTHVPSTAAPPAVTGSRTGWIPWMAAAAFAVAAAVGWLGRGSPATGVPVRWELTGFEGELGTQGGVSIAVSPRGDVFVVAGGTDWETQLYQRRADDPQFRPIPGTEDARFPTFSPEGDWLAFSQGSEIRKVQLTGGPTLPVVAQGGMPHWGTTDAIVYRGPGGIFRVTPAGGTPTLLVPDSLFSGLRGPYLLPDDSGLLFNTYDSGDPHIRLLDFASGEYTEIATGYDPSYVPTGHILFGSVDRSAGLAVPFDLGTKEVRGSPVPVIPSLTIFSFGSTQAAFSASGTLIYADRGEDVPDVERPFSWVAMDGNETPIPLEMSGVASPRVSPDGRRIVYLAAGDVWIYDIVAGSNTQLSPEGTSNEDPVWSPDGEYVYYTSEWADAGDDVVRQRSDFSSEPELVFSTPDEDDVISVSPDGDWVVVRQESQRRSHDILLAPARPGGEGREYLHADWAEYQGAVSPDGRWMAYTSDEFGEDQIFVRAFPDPGERWQVSAGAGEGPVWDPDGSAIYYISGESLLKASVRTGSTFSVESTETLFPFEYASSFSQVTYDIHPDGDRFLVQAPTGTYTYGDVFVVVNWFEELKARMGESN